MFKTLPVIPLRDMVIIPGETVHCSAGKEKSLFSAQAAMGNEGMAFFCCQRDSNEDNPAIGNLNKMGTICKIKQIFRLQDDGVYMLVTGMSRAYVQSFTPENNYFEATVCDIAELNEDAAVNNALRKRIEGYFAEFSRLTNKVNSSQRAAIAKLNDMSAYADTITAIVTENADVRQQILEETHIDKRLMRLAAFMHKELEILRLDQEIAEKLRTEIEKNQREHILREKIKVIRRELGDDEGKEIEEFRKRMEEKRMPEEAKLRLKKEIDRLEMMPSSSHEAPMARSYIECLLELPWEEGTSDNINLKRARALLEKNHYGMQKVKDRIIEYLAVQSLTGNANGQILCFVGPPGVGKTSIVASIAECMGRKFVRMSLGGIRDEAEIRGHRRTYIGAMPGRVIAAMRQAGANNPVLLFDEIDKLASDMRGDPASAMLEVLDSAQNFAFKDHFVELPYDLSRAMLITTANDVNAIPRPLLDRMEIINVQSYLDEEKKIIGRRHLLKKQLELHGLKKTSLRITDARLGDIINCYTREAGVRELERVLSAICRKAVCEIADGSENIVLSVEKLESYLGRPKYKHEGARPKNEVGVVTGLAYTPVGGKTISIEVAVVSGSGKIQLTGSLGDVMRESGHAALTYARAHATEWGMVPEEINKLDIHVHVPEGATPKDGPSAGVAMAAAIISALSGIKARADIAVTGEITLRGRVLAVGGIREKCLAALRADINEVILPAKNIKDIEEIPESVRGKFNFIFIETLDEALKLIIEGRPKRRDIGELTFNADSDIIVDAALPVIKRGGAPI